MDFEQDTRIEIDLSDLNQICVDGHGDAFTVTTGSGNYTLPNSAPQWTFTGMSINPPSSGRISLVGTDADIEINGESVVSMLRDTRDRLNMLQVSAEMEAEWAELRVLREQYEAKLIECRAKSQVWTALTQTG